MVDFRQPGNVDPTQDPNYLRQSKEPSRIKPLEQVSVPANTVNDTSWGTMLTGLGSVLEQGLSLADTTIKRNLVDDAHNAIDPIQNSHGSDLQPSDVQPIAGTGAKGRARLAAASRDNLFGTADGAGGVTAGALPFGPQEAGLDYAQLPTEITQLKPLPTGAQMEIDRASRMNEAYLNGSMSDSYYNSQLVATTKELRARYPGYRDEVDAAVSQITGVQPANALRKSLLSDLNANAAARATGQSAEEKEIQKQMPYITIFAPDFSSNRAKYQGQEQDLLNKAYQFQSRDLGITAATKSQGFDATTASSTYTDKATLQVQAAMTAINSQTDANGQTLNQRFNTIMNDPASADPKTLAPVIGTLERMKAQTLQAIDAAGTAPLDNGKTYKSTIGDPGKYTAIQTTAVAPIDSMLNALKNGDIRSAKIMNDQLQLSLNNEGIRIINASPFAKAVGGLGQIGGKEFGALVAQQPNSGISQLMSTLLPAKASETVTTPAGAQPPGIKAQLDDLSKAGKVDGKTVNAIVNQNFNMMNSEKLGTQASINAGKNLFDTSMLAALPSSSDRQLYMNKVADPATTHRVWELSKSDKQLWTQYSDFVKTGAVAVYKEAGDNLQAYITTPGMKVDYDDKAHQYTVTMTDQSNPSNARLIEEQAAARIAPLNRALAQLVPIFEKNKQDVNEQVLGFISSVGVNTSEGKTPNLPTRLLNAIKSGWSDYQQWNENQTATGNSPVRTKPNGSISGNLSD